MKLLARSQRIADLEIPGIRQTDNIAGKSLVHRLLLLRHKSSRATETQLFAETDMFIRSVTLETTGTDLYESDTTTMVRVHIGMYLKDKAGEAILFRFNHTFHRLNRTGRRGNLDKAIQQLLHTEVVQGRAEKDRCDIPFQIRIHIELRINAFDQLDVRTQLFCQRIADMVFQLRTVDIVELDLFRHILFARRIEVEFLFIYIIYPFETLSHIDRPAQRAYLYLQFFFYLIQKVERIFAVTVHLVDKHDHRCLAHTADFHQLTGLGFHTFGYVDYNNYTVYGC